MIGETRLAGWFNGRHEAADAGALSFRVVKVDPSTDDLSRLLKGELPTARLVDGAPRGLRSRGRPVSSGLFRRWVALAMDGEADTKCEIIVLRYAHSYMDGAIRHKP